MSDVSTPSRPWTAIIAVPIVVFLCWAIPRVVVALLGSGGHWTPYFYQYLLGGLVFGIGLWVIRTSGACSFHRRNDRMYFGVLIFGYMAYAALHAAGFWLAQAAPFLGAAR